MKKRFVLSALTVLLCLCMLCSCGGTLSMGRSARLSDIYNEDAFVNDPPTLKKGETISDLNGELFLQKGDLAVIKDGGSSSPRYRVYNFVTGKVVLEWNDTSEKKLTGDKIGLLVVDDATLFWVVSEKKEDKKTTTSTAIYDSDGNEITTLSKKTAPVAVADMMMVENRYYRKEDGVYQLKFEHSRLSAELPEFTTWTKDYYYSLNDKGFSIYNPSGMPVGSYSFCLDASNCAANVMNNGNVLIQYTLVLPYDSSSYDIYNPAEDKKYELVSLIYNAKTGNTKEVDLDYVMSTNLGRDLSGDMPSKNILFDIINKNIDNIAIVIPIEDKRVGKDIVVMVSVDNQGSVKSVLNRTLSDQSSIMAFPAVKDRYVVTTQNGLTVLVNGKGDRIGEISKMEDANNAFIITDGRLYDMDLRYVYDYSNEGYELYEVLDDVLILSKQAGSGSKATNTYYFMKAGMSEPEKFEHTFEESCERYYVLKDSGKNYIYYNAGGEEIYRSTKKLELVGESTDGSALLFKSDTAYYRLTA